MSTEDPVRTTEITADTITFLHPSVESRFVDVLDGFGGALQFNGPPNIGRTTLLEELARISVEHGRKPIWLASDSPVSSERPTEKVLKIIDALVNNGCMRRDAVVYRELVGGGTTPFTFNEGITAIKSATPEQVGTEFLIFLAEFKKEISGQLVFFIDMEEPPTFDNVRAFNDWFVDCVSPLILQQKATVVIASDRPYPLFDYLARNLLTTVELEPIDLQPRPEQTSLDLVKKHCLDLAERIISYAPRQLYPAGLAFDLDGQGNQLAFPIYGNWQDGYFLLAGDHFTEILECEKTLSNHNNVFVDVDGEKFTFHLCKNILYFDLSGKMPALRTVPYREGEPTTRGVIMAKDFVPDSEFPSLEFADPYHTHLAQWLYCLTHLAGTLPHDRSTILDLIADALTNVSKLEFPHSPIYQNTIGGIRK